MTSGSERGRKLWTGLFIGALRFLLSLSFRCVLLSLSVTASFDYLFLVFFFLTLIRKLPAWDSKCLDIVLTVTNFCFFIINHFLLWPFRIFSNMAEC